MKIYIKNASACYDHPEDIGAILSYLAEKGKILCSDETVERMYREFSDDMYAAGWMCVDERILEEFSDWLAEIDL